MELSKNTSASVRDHTSSDKDLAEAKFPEHDRTTTKITCKARHRRSLARVASPSDAVISLAADAVLSPADAIAAASSAAAYAEEPPTTTTATTTATTMHKCESCCRTFTRRAHLVRHTRTRCRPNKPFSCDVCKSSFGRKDNLDRHKRTVQCGSPPQPEPAPKRRRIASLDEDPVTPPPVEPSNDNLSSDLQDAVRDNWGSIRTYVAQGPVQTRYNHQLTTMDTRELQQPLRQLFDQQTTAFKINCSYGFLLKNKTTNRFRYYHSSNNCCGRYLEEPSLVTNSQTFNAFLERIKETDVLQSAIAQRPNSDWVVELVTNVTFFLNRIIHHPIGCVGVTLSDYLKHNKAVVGLAKDEHGATYNDNLCLFRCLALHQGCDVRHLEATVVTLYANYTDTLVHDFAGVTIDDLSKIEATFGVNVVVYKLDEITDGTTVGELVRRSLCQFTDTMTLNLYETHFSYIRDINMYCHSYRCSRCGESLWKYPLVLYPWSSTRGRGPKVFVPGTGQVLNSTCIRTNQSSEGIRYSVVLTERIRRQRRNTRTIGQQRSQPTAF